MLGGGVLKSVLIKISKLAEYTKNLNFGLPKTRLPYNAAERLLSTHTNTGTQNSQVLGKDDLLSL